MSGFPTSPTRPTRTMATPAKTVIDRWKSYGARQPGSAWAAAGRLVASLWGTAPLAALPGTAA